MDKTNSPSAAVSRCWSCNAEVALTDNFCRHCGMGLQSSTSPSINIHERLVSIEKRLLSVLIGVGALLLLIGWILLQLYHFGRGGGLG